VARIPRRERRCKARPLAVVVALVVALVGVRAGADEAPGWVRVRGAAFWLDGGPFHFVGVNLAVMHGAERGRYLETIVHAREDGAMVGRI